MKAVPVWVYYSVLRIVLFAVPLAILLALRVEWWLSALLAALIGLCLSYIFLRRSRNAMSSDLYAARHPEKEPISDDAASEDAAIDLAAAEDAASVSTTATISQASEGERKPE
ncbi:DUF4229 domain-containing protein [Glaciibacter psychrotolerans]|uniref:DUF4229 domain-containing protein n=1 Tax=Glaciibacter psychrotolerans TaxID=670054 RepID=A0A7Z0EFX9_9MICO|nr:DUF4229 domain-containing protein [Leifsonia psychrotolerans]NYJ20731.1 hypothetical protein [Leifsonia psychrotolerans]